MKKPFLIGVVFLILVAIFWNFSRKSSSDDPSPLSEDETVHHSSDKREKARSTYRATQKLVKLESGEENIIHASDFKENEHELTKLNNEYVRYLGGGNRMTIKNTKGLLLYQASDENPAIRVQSIQGGGKISVSRGNGRYRIIDTKTAEFFDLPVKPPRNNALGFGSWDWLSADLLIGTSGIDATNGADKALRCCDQHTVSSSLLYFYNIPNRTLTEVKLPKSLTGKVFNLNRVTTDGFIELISSSGHKDDGQPLGWVKVNQ